jgi:hypothetical protein
MVVLSSYVFEGKNNVRVWKSTDTSFYNRSGFLISAVTHAKDTFNNERNVYNYDDNNRLVKITHNDLNNSPKKEEIYSYDQKGNLTDHKKLDLLFNVVEEEQYFYNNNNICIRTLSSRTDPYSLHQKEVIITLNDKGLRVKEKKIENGRSETTEIAYDEKENPISYVSRDVIIQMHYSAEKLCAVSVFQKNHSLLSRAFYNYDKQGRQISYKRINASGYLEDSLEHEYDLEDKRGNWLKTRICYMNRITAYEERVITYYR